LHHDLKKYANGRTNLKILDLACACGHNYSICKNYGEYNGIDISDTAIKYCNLKKIPNVTVGDVQNLTFESESFDVVLSMDVFEHIEDDIACMKKIIKVLKPGGKLIFNTPALMMLYSYHDKGFHHFRRYRAGEISKKLKIAGFKITFITYWSFFIFPFVLLMRKVLFKKRQKNVESLSDFHLNIPEAIKIVLEKICKLEVLLIRKRARFPLGVSLYGIAQKEI